MRRYFSDIKQTLYGKENFREIIVFIAGKGQILINSHYTHAKFTTQGRNQKYWATQLRKELELKNYSASGRKVIEVLA